MFRAAALVDSVYLDRQRDSTTVDAGDFTAYLMARLGLRVIPPDFGFTVTADTLQLRIGELAAAKRASVKGSRFKGTGKPGAQVTPGLVPEIDASTK